MRFAHERLSTPFPLRETFADAAAVAGRSTTMVAFCISTMRCCFGGFGGGFCGFFAGPGAADDCGADGGAASTPFASAFICFFFSFRFAQCFFFFTSDSGGIGFDCPRVSPRARGPAGHVDMHVTATALVPPAPARAAFRFLREPTVLARIYAFFSSLVFYSILQCRTSTSPRAPTAASP